MPITIVRFASDGFPGFVNCEMTDAAGVVHCFVEKVPMLTSSYLDENSLYPVSETLACEVLDTWLASDGRMVSRIDTWPSSVWPNEASSIFDVLAADLKPLDEKTLAHLLLAPPRLEYSSRSVAKTDSATA
ncbi:hypothetical protein [Prosthecobacter sp.]